MTLRKLQDLLTRWRIRKQTRDLSRHALRCLRSRPQPIRPRTMREWLT